ncbi:MAG: 2-oxo acid dehydrogenase subunit E2 [Candidatus Hydrogenedentes bacterium]|nr:2-oxo acid dehydrogenase subunit E2 [Candidatus Hydrogenedentota bacterium]
MHEIKIPQLGQSVEEASIVMWHKKEGESVQTGEPLFTVQTDKAEIECESSATGVLRKVLVGTDVVVPVLKVVALVGDRDEPLPDLSQYWGEAKTATPSPHSVTVSANAKADLPSKPTTESGGVKFVSPRARAKARAEHVNAEVIEGSGAQGRVMEADVVAFAETLQDVPSTPTARRIAGQEGIDLSQVSGTGPRGRVTKEDILRARQAATVSPSPAGVRRVPLTPMRKTIARRMSESFFTAPHYYVTVEVDMSAVRRFRDVFTSFKPSFNDIIILATAQAIKAFPQVNVRWAGDAIEEREDINIGIAVALPDGLIVPVLRQVQDKSLEAISFESRDLVEKARNGKLLPDEYSGNTFTISNLGAYGVDHFTAIVNPPDSAILAIGQIKDQPVVIEGGIHVRPVMKLTLSSDHRVIDGAVAAQFLGQLKRILEAAEF